MRGRAAAAILAVAAACASAAPAHAEHFRCRRPPLRAHPRARLDRGPRGADARVAPPAAPGSARMLSPLGKWTGGPVGLLVLKARPGWVQVRLPNRPNRAAAWVSADRVVLRPTRWRVEIDVASGG